VTRSRQAIDQRLALFAGPMATWGKTVEHAKEDLREGRSPTTLSGEFVHEENRTRATRQNKCQASRR